MKNSIAFACIITWCIHAFPQSAPIAKIERWTKTTDNKLVVEYMITHAKPNETYVISIVFLNQDSNSLSAFAISGDYPQVRGSEIKNITWDVLKDRQDFPEIGRINITITSIIKDPDPEITGAGGKKETATDDARDIILKQQQQKLDSLQKVIESLKVKTEEESRQKSMEENRLDSIRMDDLEKTQAELSALQESVNNKHRQDSIDSAKQIAEARLQLEKLQKKEDARNLRKTKPNRISLKLGYGAHHYEPTFDNIGSITENINIGYLANGMLAYRYNVKKTGKKERGSSVGLFGNYGNLNYDAMAGLVNANFSNRYDKLEDKHPFMEIEGGFLFGEWFRLSTGIGSQTIISNDEHYVYNYQVFTCGLVMRFNLIEVDLSGSTLFGEFYEQPAIRVSLSINLHLKMGRW